MRKNRFTEAQIVETIQDHEAEILIVEVCRRHGLTTSTFDKMKAKYGAMECPRLRGIRPLRTRMPN